MVCPRFLEISSLDRFGGGRSGGGQGEVNHEGVPHNKSKSHRALADCHDVLEAMRAYVNNV